MRLLTFLATLILSSITYSQQIDFENYKPLKSQGPIPEVVTTMLSDVFDESKNERIEGVGYSKSQQYYQESSYGLKEILTSGLVLFNDPISTYVEKVGRKVINSDDELKEIQFFTIRSNVVNAFVTPGGNVFVTQGLVAQLENEAQLAYILAHEISHFKMNHNVIKFQERIEVMRSGGSYSNRIKKLSNYSKDKEFGADSLGVYYYHEANYAKKELYNVFDVLSYSYLPFDLEEFPKDYFNTDLLYVPESFFEDELPEISFDEDYDDSKSSHPNIESRREHVSEWVDRLDKWGNKVFHFSEEEFYEIRELARFESVRNDLYDVRPENTLYSIFLLERKYPDNAYLKISKAKAWSQMISLRASGDFFSQLSRTSNVQGDPHRLVKFLRNLDEEALYTMALRNIIDVKNDYPDSRDAQNLYDFALLELAKNDDFDIEDYKEITFQNALSRFNYKRDSIKLSDSLALLSSNTEEEDLKTEENESKYDKIRNQQDTEVAVNATDSFDIEKFYIYGLSDLMDSSFLNAYELIKEKANDIIERDEYYENLTYRERKELKKEFHKYGMRRDIDSIVLIQPEVEIENRFGGVNLQKSVEAEEYVQTVFSENGEYHMQSGSHVNILSLANNSFTNLEVIHGRNIAINSIRLMTYFDDINLYPVEADELDLFKDLYGSKYLGLFLAENYKNGVISPSMLYTVFIPPLFAFQLTTKIMKRNSTDYTFVVFNLDSQEFEVEAVHTTSLYGSRTNRTIASMLNYYLTELTQQYEK